MNTTKVKATDMFEECGLKIQGAETFRRSLKSEFVLPKKIDLERLEKTVYDDWDEGTKIRIIKRYICTNYNFRMPDWNFFLPNIEFANDEKQALTLVFNSIKLYLINEKITFYFQTHPFLELLQKQLKNKDFLKTLSNEFQLKSVFSTDKMMLKEFKTEILNLLKNKILESGFKEKFEIGLPKLIMEELE